MVPNWTQPISCGQILRTKTVGLKNMKSLLLITILIGTISAEELHWKIVESRAEISTDFATKWTFTIQNISDRTLNVAQDWSIKENASTNLYVGSFDAGKKLSDMPYGAGSKLFSESCHTPTQLKVEPGATINAVITVFADYDRDRLTLGVIEGDKRTAIGTLSKIAPKGQQGGTGQPATRPESKSEGSDKPQPESEGRSR